MTGGPKHILLYFIGANSLKKCMIIKIIWHAVNLGLLGVVAPLCPVGNTTQRDRKINLRGHEMIIKEEEKHFFYLKFCLFFQLFLKCWRVWPLEGCKNNSNEAIWAKTYNLWRGQKRLITSVLRDVLQINVVQLH